MTIALVTGATQGLGLALVAGLARRLSPDDTVLLTGRDPARIAAAVQAVTGAGPSGQHGASGPNDPSGQHDPNGQNDPGGPNGRHGRHSPSGARVVGEVFDVADPDAAERLAGKLGAVDIVFGNAVMRVGPDDDPRAVIDEYTQVNNFGTTRLLRAFAPRLRDGGRIVVVASSLGTLHHLAPVLHARFDGLASLDEVDAQTARWRDEVAGGQARAMAWPGFVNIPSKIAQVAAVRALAAQRRDEDRRRGILVAAACPGMINTPTSGLWWDVSSAASPDEAAGPLLELALGAIEPGHYGELVRFGQALPWRH